MDNIQLFFRQTSAVFQPISKMGLSLTIKRQSLLDVLYFGHILDTFSHVKAYVEAVPAKDNSGRGPGTKT